MTSNLAVVVGRGRSRSDQRVAQALMVSLGVIVRGILGHDLTQVLFAEQDDLVEALTTY